jgi:hypothetical protein
LLCLEGSCVPNSQGQISVYFVSGTSASAPSFAGIMTYVDQQNSILTGDPRVGLPNFILYRLAATQSAYPSQCNGSNTAALPNSACIFNDVTSGNNVVPGEVGTNYSAGAGYDLATGLGSLNVANLLSNWSSVTFNPTTTALSMTPPTNLVHGTPLTFAATVTPNSGTGSPTGEVTLEALTGLGGPGLSGMTLAGTYTLSGGSVSSTTAALPGGGPYFVTANYSGDSTYAPSTSTAVSVTVGPEPSTTTVSVLTGSPSGQAIPFSNGPFGSFVYLRADVAGQSGQGFATGSVTFTDTFGAIPGGGTFSLNGESNTATPNGVFTFDTGTHTISASYSGDASFNPSSSTQQQTFTITPGFFASIPTAQSSVSIAAPGGSGTSSVSVSYSSGFSGTITLACSGLPSEATCAFTPATITPGATASTTTSTITVTTTAATALAGSRRRIFFPASWAMGVGLVFSMICMSGKQRRVRALFLLLVLTLLVVVPACGGGGGGSSTKTPPPNVGTPAGTSNVTVTATSGTNVSSAGFTLIVQ